MQLKPNRESLISVDNAIARKALEEIDKIDDDAQQKRLAQVATLQSARAAILQRISELTHQLTQLDQAIEKITGEPARNAEKRTRRNMDEVRERVARWMEARRGNRFMAGDFVQEFPELEGMQISMFIKPLVLGGKVKTDASEGPQRMKYYIEG